MRCRLSMLLCVSLLAGCAASAPVTVVHQRATNLALGPTREHAWLAEGHSRRALWPAVANGYRDREVTFYNVTIYDEQRSYDRNHGLFHGSQSIRSGVRIR